MPDPDRLSQVIAEYGHDPVRYIEDKLLLPALRHDELPSRSAINDLMEKCWSVEGLMYEALYECRLMQKEEEAERVLIDVRSALEEIPNQLVRDCLQERIQQMWDCYGPGGRLVK